VVAVVFLGSQTRMGGAGSPFDFVTDRPHEISNPNRLLMSTYFRIEAEGIPLIIMEPRKQSKVKYENRKPRHGRRTPKESIQFDSRPANSAFSKRVAKKATDHKDVSFCAYLTLQRQFCFSVTGV
jgi:hypothetical protein